MKNQNSISRMLARWAVFVAIALGILTSAIETTFDFFDELNKTDLLANDILIAAKPSAGEATHQIDSNLAREVLRGIFSYHFVHSTKIIDDFGTELAKFDRGNTDSRHHIGWKLFGDNLKTYEINLEDPNQTQSTGRLNIVIDQNIAFEEFYQRSILNFIVGFLKNGLLLLVLFYIFFRFIDQPLISLIDKIDSVDPKNPKPLVPSTNGINNDNEIGKLEAATNRLLSASQQHLFDLTKTQHALVENEIKLNDFATAASDWFWETDENLAVTSVTDRFFELSGKTPEEVIGSNLTAMSTGREFHANEKNNLQRSTKEQEPFREIAISLKRRNGEPVYASISGIPHYNKEGEFIGYRGIGTDQTDLVKSELERQRLTDDLQHTQKLRVLGQLTGGISHDFNNLLAVVMGNLDLIKIDTKLSKKAQNFLNLAIDATNRGAQLTRRLLAYSRQQQLVPKAINPGPLLFGLEELLRRSLGERIDMEVVVGGGLWRCRADAQELETVILNLAINARDAMPEGGKLTIEVFNARLDPSYALSEGEVEPGQYVCFALSDNGTGIGKDMLDKVFEPYFTTKPVGEGSGLGLSMAYGFAKQSGGHIKIYSEAGKGTTVKLYLPRTLKDAFSEISNLPPLQDVDQLRGLNVLVVEDQLEVRMTICSQLEHFGCNIVEASRGVEAIEICKANRNFDVLLLDIILPGNQNGSELSHDLCKLVPHAEVLFMSGYTENSIVHNEQLDGSVGLIQKPFSGSELAIALLGALKKSGRNKGNFADTAL